MTQQAILEEEVYECQYYMTHPEIHTLFTALVCPIILEEEDDDCCGHPVIAFWSNLLRLSAYFRQPSAADLPGTGLWYLYETPVLHEVLPDEGSSEWSLLTVSRYGRGKQKGRTTKVVCIGRTLDCDTEPSSAMWTDGIGKLERYLDMVAAQPEQQDESIYGIVSIGQTSRFFEAKNAASRLGSVPPDDRNLHLAGDEESIHAILGTWARNSRQQAVLLS